MTDAVFPPLQNGQVSIQKLAECAVLHLKDCEYCEECFAVFKWDEIPDEYIKMGHERHPYGSTFAYEPVVRGWTCPVCGHFIQM